LHAHDADSLRLRLAVPGQCLTGESVPIRLTIENAGEQSLDLYLLGRTITFDVIVTRAGGDTVWRRLEGAIVPAILRIETLAPGATIELTDTWDQRDDRGLAVPPGDYGIHAELLTETKPLASRRVPLRIHPLAGR
jgi:hypothetical protein